MEISMTEERKPTLTVVTGDKFDPNALRIGQDFMAKAGVTRLLTEVPFTAAAQAMVDSLSSE
jgi:hypothetical protein